jgi:hypothetical protein
MDREVQQLVEMVSAMSYVPLFPVLLYKGATVSQARAALKHNKDVMQAAEQIFEGRFDKFLEVDEDVQMDSVSISDRADPRKLNRLAVRRCICVPGFTLRSLYRRLRRRKKPRGRDQMTERMMVRHLTTTS